MRPQRLRIQSESVSPRKAQLLLITAVSSSGNGLVKGEKTKAFAIYSHRSLQCTRH